MAGSKWRIVAIGLAVNAVLAGRLALQQARAPALLTGIGTLHRILLLVGLLLWAELAPPPRLAGLEHPALLRLPAEALAAYAAVLAGALVGFTTGFLLMAATGAGVNALTRITPLPQQFLQQSGPSGIGFAIAIAGVIGVGAGGAVAATLMTLLTGRFRRGGRRRVAWAGALAALALAPLVLVPLPALPPLFVLLFVLPGLMVAASAPRAAWR